MSVSQFTRFQDAQFTVSRQGSKIKENTRVQVNFQLPLTLISHNHQIISNLIIYFEL